MFDSAEYLAVHTTASVDNNGRFFGFGLVVSDGLEVIVQRTGGDWEYFIDGVYWHPNTVNNGSGVEVDPDGSVGSPNLNAAPDLYVGVFAITVFNGNAKTALVDAFEVTVVPEPATALLTVSIGAAVTRWRIGHTSVMTVIEVMDAKLHFTRLHVQKASRWRNGFATIA
jgi:hypothetical protein